MAAFHSALAEFRAQLCAFHPLNRQLYRLQLANHLLQFTLFESVQQGRKGVVKIVQVCVGQRAVALALFRLRYYGRKYLPFDLARKRLRERRGKVNRLLFALYIG